MPPEPATPRDLAAACDRLNRRIDALLALLEPQPRFMQDRHKSRRSPRLPGPLAGLLAGHG
jgi:hypothetical protein